MARTQGADVLVRLTLRLALLAALALPLPRPAHAQTAPAVYQFAAPAGWNRAQDGDTEVLTPAAEQAGTAQVLVLAPKPLTGDFDQQFATERAALEQFWGLRAPAPVAPQRGQSARGPYAAYFASYDSDGGPRYMSFLALAQGQQFALMVFVAASDEAFNRLAPAATEMFKTLQVIRR